MFSPGYFEKQSCYLKSLGGSLDIAVSPGHKVDPESRLVICHGCEKPQLFATTHDREVPSQPQPSESNDVSKTSAGTYVTAVMSTLLETRSPQHDLNKSVGADANNDTSHRQRFLKRRPSIRAEMAPRVKQNGQKSEGHAEPVTKIAENKVNDDEKQIESSKNATVSFNESINKSSSVTAATTRLNKNQGVVEANSRSEAETSRDVYYSLSPLMMKDLLRSDSKSPSFSNDEITPGCETPPGMKKDNIRSSEDDDSPGSSQKKPEYFSVLSKKNRKRDRSLSFGTFYGRHSNSYHNVNSEMTTPLPSSSKRTSRCRRRNIICSSAKGTNITQLPSLQVQARQLPPKPFDCDKLADDSLDCDDPLVDSGRNNEGILLSFSNTFEIGDVCSEQPIFMNDSLADDDFMRDGYCQCSFCNHDEIFASTQGKDLIDVSGMNASDCASPLLRIRRRDLVDSAEDTTQWTHSDSRLPDCSPPLLMEDLSSTSLDCTSDSYKRSPHHQEILDLFCQCRGVYEEESKNLQKDVEKHSSGVASVLNLCEVLLHDDDACANDEDRKSIEDASQSLDRRWRNICALSMDRKLKIEDTQRLWQRFLTDLARFSDWLVKCETTSQHPDSQCVTYLRAREELRSFKGFERQVHEGLGQLDMINKQYRRLARENRTDVEDKLKTMVQEVSKRWDDLSRRVSFILRRLSFAIERRETFEALRQSLVVWLTETELQLTNMEYLSPNSDEFEKVLQVKEFQHRIEDRIPLFHDLDDRGLALICHSEPSDCVDIEEELDDFHEYCCEMIARLDRYHRKLLSIMNPTDDEDKLIFDDGEMQDFYWYKTRSHDKPKSPGTSPFSLPDEDAKIYRSINGRLTPISNGSLEWDNTYDMSQSELEAKLASGGIPDDISLSDLSSLGDHDEVVRTPFDVSPLVSTPDRKSTRLSPFTKNNTSSEGDLSSSKRRRIESPDHKQQRQQFESDLDQLLGWLASIQPFKDVNSNISVEEFEHEIKELKNFERDIESRKPVFLSVNLVASRFGYTSRDVTTDFADETGRKLIDMSAKWQNLNMNVTRRKENLQKCIGTSQNFSQYIRDTMEWTNTHEQRRADLVIVSSNVTTLKKTNKALVQLRIEALEKRVEISYLQEALNYLLYGVPMSSLHGATKASEKLNEITVRLNELLKLLDDDVRLNDLSLKRERHITKDDVMTDSSAISDLDSSSPLGVKRLQRKILTSSEERSDEERSNEPTRVHSISFDQEDTTVTTALTSIIERKQTSSLHLMTSLSNSREHLRETEVPDSNNLITVGSDRNCPNGEITSSHGAVSSTKRGTTDLFYAPIYFDRHRVLKATLIFYIFFAFLFILVLFPFCEDPNACLYRNNLHYSWYPTLAWNYGPPPT